MHARNPERSTEIGGNKVAFAPTYGSPFVYDFDNQRRYGTLADLNQFHQLAYMAPAMHNTGAVICEPVDIAIPKRHLHITYSAIKHSDKPFMGPVTAPERAEDALRMARILFGDGRSSSRHTVIIALVNCNSPLVWDETMLGALKVYARANQSVIVSPFVLAGANTPASAVGSVAQLNAEALAGIAFAQLCRPGCPMIYGHFLAAVSMKSGAPMAGTPEIAFMNLMIGQLARKYRPAAALLGHDRRRQDGRRPGGLRIGPDHVGRVPLGRQLHHALRRLERGGARRELRQVRARLRADRDVLPAGPGAAVRRPRGGARRGARDRPGRPLSRHRRTPSEHFQTAFFMPELLDNNSFEQWELDGAKDANQRGLEAARHLLANYEPPPLDPAIDEALLAFIREREAVLPDSVT